VAGEEARVGEWDSKVTVASATWGDYPTTMRIE
jgi:hypothetical protein